MALDRGEIRARIWAPPRLFFVNTPSATAIDLGCAYTLQVDDRGWGKVRVETGWVAFEHKGRESFIPKDAMCATRPGVGPGYALLRGRAGRAGRGAYDSRLLVDTGRKKTGRTQCRTDERTGQGRADALAPAVARAGQRARACVRQDGRPRAAPAGGHAGGGDRRERRPRSTRGGTRWVSTAHRGGASGKGPGNSRANGVVFAHVLTACPYFVPPAGPSSAFSCCFIGAQFVRPDRTNPASPAGHLADGKAPPQVTAILDRSCRDCHTNDTRWPWYTNISPTTGSSRITCTTAASTCNFSDWSAYDEDDQDKFLGGICD